MSSISLITLLPVLAFILFLILQTLQPRRVSAKNGFSVNWRNRSLHNYLLFLINSILFRLIVPLTLIATSVFSNTHQLGLANWYTLDSWWWIIFCVVVLDLAIYWQHVATHKLDFLWRFHKVHHADTHMDVTTALRFHPIELLLSLFYKSLLVLILGAPVIAVVIFELLLFIGPAFNHSNWRMPLYIDKVVRVFIVTPDMHRAHHSIYKTEQDTNYGFLLSCWDQLFKTYTESPKDGHLAMKIGLNDHKEGDTVSLYRMLTMPFK